ncbi:MAG TPA: class I SAM-dependent methyltransferase [Syntrophomonadaceae bacterium]|nr:class I SAM-dependent methyltransferase [Syntrophomonadaceae bacterium]
MNLIVTSPLAAETKSAELEQFLTDIDLPYVPRGRKSLPKLMQEYQADGVVVWKVDGPVLYFDNEQFFFHPNMAKIRIGAFRKQGQVDPMIEACGLKAGDRFLDCTLGLGADAIVAAYFTRTKVMGLESSQVITAIIKWGMRQFHSDISWLSEPIRNIEVIHADHYEFLAQLDSKSFDVVYFDPMFRQPLLKSQPLSPLRRLADPRPLSRDTIKQACRVARSRVVVKERYQGEEFKRLGIEIIHSTSGQLAYGIINVS